MSSVLPLCPVTYKPCGSCPTPVNQEPRQCTARQAQEAEQGYPERDAAYSQEPRVLHADLSREEAERRVDESRVPPERSIPRIVERHCDVSSAIDAVKDTNPKDAIGVLKVALSYVSLPVILEVALGMMEGGFKYGRHNYREAGVRASVYVDATFRHLALFWEGEDYDPDIFAITADANGENGVRVSHITKAIASLTVLRDSMIRGNWVDDRPPAVAPGWLVKLSGDVKKLAKAYPNPVPPVTEIGLSAKKERVS
jgi:hypothetical protein